MNTSETKSQTNSARRTELVKEETKDVRVTMEEVGEEQAARAVHRQPEHRPLDERRARAYTTTFVLTSERLKSATPSPRCDLPGPRKLNEQQSKEGFEGG